MTDRRPFTKADDQYLLAAHAEGTGYLRMARALERSVASIRGRVKRLLSQPTRVSDPTPQSESQGADRYRLFGPGTG